MMKLHILYLVKYNRNANAQLVSGTNCPFEYGAAASVAIDQNAGTVIMLPHTK